eukprot:841532-Rhodomonas_salina.2
MMIRRYRGRGYPGNSLVVSLEKRTRPGELRQILRPDTHSPCCQAAAGPVCTAVLAGVLPLGRGRRVPGSTVTVTVTVVPQCCSEPGTRTVAALAYFCVVSSPLP